MKCPNPPDFPKQAFGQGQNIEGHFCNCTLNSIKFHGSVSWSNDRVQETSPNKKFLNKVMTGEVFTKAVIPTRVVTISQRDMLASWGEGILSSSMYNLPP